jgi:hypothetical protein
MDFRMARDATAISMQGPDSLGGISCPWIRLESVWLFMSRIIHWPTPTSREQSRKARTVLALSRLGTKGRRMSPELRRRRASPSETP